MARPRKDIDPEQVEKLAQLGLSYAEIAAVLDCDASTLTRRFAQVIKKGHEHRDASLRRTQFDVAVNQKNPTMLIWLGKQFLGQRDKQELSGENGGPITFSIEHVDR
jgi:hypothetical protein